MKAILMSIQPKWCELIASGKKTIEVRKTKPKCDVPFKVYMYACKPKHYYKISAHMTSSDERLYLHNGKVKMCDGFEFWADNVKCEFLSGKVIGEFVCDRLVWVISHPDTFAGCSCLHVRAIKDACMTEDEAETYSGGSDVYGYHISDLVIYDEPKKLGEFSGLRKTKFGYEPIKITRAPQSWCYVEEVQA